MRCLICRNGIMNKDVGTYFTQMQGCYVIIENVPCWKCDHCGEIVYSASVLEKIEEILGKVEKVAGKIFILMWQKTPCLYRREMNATSTEFTQVIEVDNRT